MTKTGGIYIHVPFCQSRCIYCDFYSTTYGAEWKRSYVDSLKREMQLRREDVDVAACLIYTSRQRFTRITVHGVVHAEVGVVLYLVNGYAQLRMGLLIAEQSFNTCVRLASKRLVPP